MKKIFFIAYLITSSFVFSQDYTFTKSTKCISYTDSTNKIRLKCDKPEYYESKFSYQRNSSGVNTLTKRNKTKDQWAAEIKRYGNFQYGDGIFSKSLYYDGENRTSITVLLSIDGKKLIMHFENDDVLIFE